MIKAVYGEVFDDEGNWVKRIQSFAEFEAKNLPQIIHQKRESSDLVVENLHQAIVRSC